MKNKIIATTIISILFGLLTSCKKEENNNNTVNNATTPIISLDTSTLNVYGNYAEVYLNIVNSGGSSITACGICYSTSPNPTIADNIINEGSLGPGLYICTVSPLTPLTMYYAKAFATNSYGTIYTNEFSFTTPGLTVTIGQQFQGGKVGYILQSGDPGYDSNTMHGFVVQTTDSKSNVLWGCNNVTIGSSGTLIGTGAQNTQTFIGNPCHDLGYQNYIPCNSLYNVTYCGWHIPSSTELYKLYLNQSIIGGFATGSNKNYWSSSEASATTAWTVNFGSGSTYMNPKGGPISGGNLAHVRLIKYF